jgi:transposase
MPRNTPANQTVIASLHLSGMGPSMRISGGTDTDAFAASIEHMLGPTLRRGQIVLVDNLSAHTAPRIGELLAARGCRLWFLPPYSPDFSPIELAFAKIKSILQSRGARTIEALEQAIAAALGQISAADAEAFSAIAATGFHRQWLKLFALSYKDMRLRSYTRHATSQRGLPVEEHLIYQEIWPSGRLIHLKLTTLVFITSIYKSFFPLTTISITAIRHVEIGRLGFSKLMTIGYDKPIDLFVTKSFPVRDIQAWRQAFKTLGIMVE